MMRVVHPHAAFVEYAHDRPALAEARRDFARGGRRFARDGGRIEGVDMREVMRDATLGQPLIELGFERRVGEGLAPQGGVGDAGLGQRAVEVQHADETGPLAGPVGDGQDRRAMADQAGKNVVGVLPDRLGHDDRRARVDLGEDLEAFLLAGNEAVLAGWVIWVGALDLDVAGRQRLDDLLLHRGLRRPAGFVGALAQIAARRHQDFLARSHSFSPCVASPLGRGARSPVRKQDGPRPKRPRTRRVRRTPSACARLHQTALEGSRAPAAFSGSERVRIDAAQKRRRFKSLAPAAIQPRLRSGQGKRLIFSPVSD